METIPRPPSASREANANGHPLPLRWKRTIAIIWTGQADSILATIAATFAVLWHITATADSALMLSAAGIASLLPVALLSPLGGVAADRFNKRHVMIAADGIAGAFSLALAVAVGLGFSSMLLLLSLLAARATAQAFHGPSLMALMPELVPERDMVRINTLDQTLSSGSAIIGPAVGIALYTAWGFSAVLVMDALCAALACLCLAVARLPYARSDAPSSAGVTADLRDGAAAIAHDRPVAALLVMVMLAMLLFLPLGTLSPLMTYDWFGGGGFAASLVEAAAGIGLLVARWPCWHGAAVSASWACLRLPALSLAPVASSAVFCPVTHFLSMWRSSGWCSLPRPPSTRRSSRLCRSACRRRSSVASWGFLGRSRLWRHLWGLRLRGRPPRRWG